MTLLRSNRSPPFSIKAALSSVSRQMVSPDALFAHGPALHVLSASERAAMTHQELTFHEESRINRYPVWTIKTLLMLCMNIGYMMLRLS